MREEDYEQATERPSKEVFDFRTSNCDQDENKVGGDERVVLRAKPEAGGHAIAWVIPNVLSLEECKEVIALGEDYGIAPSNKPVLRTSKRTDHYENQELSDRIFARVKPHCVPFCADTGNGDYMGTLDGIHHNWRIVRYDKGDAFPAHQDQMDSFQIKDPADGTKDLIVSSHTVLLNLSSPEKGGATRFYLPSTNSSIKQNEKDHYSHPVDVFLPAGWALVFSQRGTIHAGQPILEGQKYVAQAGLLRKLPPGKLYKPCPFRLGPGLQEMLEHKVAKLDVEGDSWRDTMFSKQIE